MICISTTTESNLDEAIDKLRKITDDIKKEKEISQLVKLLFLFQNHYFQFYLMVDENKNDIKIKIEIFILILIQLFNQNQITLPSDPSLILYHL